MYLGASSLTCEGAAASAAHAEEVDVDVELLTVCKEAVIRYVDDVVVRAEVGKGCDKEHGAVLSLADV